MEPLLTRLLNLPGIVVETCRDTETELMLEVEAWTTQAVCPRCGLVSSHLHQNHGHWVRDLPISGRQVWLKVNRRQFKCMSCGKPFSEDLDFVDIRRKYTNRLAAEILQQVRHSDVHNVAKNNDLTDEEVWSMVEHISKKKLKIDLSQLRRLGIDEIALKKGHKDFIVVLVDLDTMKPIAFVKSRKQTDIREVLDSWGTLILSQIQEVSMDMSGNYKGLVTELLPNAVITVDRFHVMKLVNEELDQARRQAKKAVEDIEEPTQKEKAKASHHRLKYVLLKSQASLNEEQREKLAALPQVSPTLTRMHQLKENFREIFETASDWGDGTLKLLDWLVNAQTDFQKSVGTITRWCARNFGVL